MPNERRSPVTTTPPQGPFAGGGVALPIAESDVTNLPTDLAAKVDDTEMQAFAGDFVPDVTNARTLGSQVPQPTGLKYWLKGFIKHIFADDITPNAGPDLTLINIHSPGNPQVTLDLNLLTAARTQSFPDATGTIALTSDLTGVSEIVWTATDFIKNNDTVLAINPELSKAVAAGEKYLFTAVLRVLTNAAAGFSFQIDGSGINEINYDYICYSSAGVAKASPTSFSGGIREDINTGTNLYTVIVTGWVITNTGSIDFKFAQETGTVFGTTQVRGNTIDYTRIS